MRSQPVAAPSSVDSPSFCVLTKVSMEVKVEELAPCKRKLEWVIPPEAVQSELDEKLQDLRSTVLIPGFRPGRAPVGLIQKRFAEQIRDDVRQSLLSSSCTEAFKQEGLTPLGEPEMDAGDMDAEQGFAISVTVNVKPSFEVQDYAAITIAKPAGEVTDELVQQQLDRMRESKAVLSPLGEGGLAADDEIACDLEITGEGIEEPVRQDDVDIPLSHPAVPGLEFADLGKQIEGAALNESREVEATATDDFEVEAARGKPVKVKVTILDAKRKSLPDLDDEFAKIYRMETLDELKDSIRSQLESATSQRTRQTLRERLEEALLDQYSFEMPQEIVDMMAESTVMRERQRMESQGVAPGEIDSRMEELRGAGEDYAVRQFKTMLILEAIAEKEKVFVTESDVQQRIEIMARGYAMTPVQMRHMLDSNDRLSSMRNQMRDDKTLDMLLEKITITEEDEAESAAADTEDTPKDEAERPSEAAEDGAGEQAQPESPAEDTEDTLKDQE